MQAMQLFYGYPELTKKILEKLEIGNYQNTSMVCKLFNEISKYMYKENIVDNEIKNLFQQNLSDSRVPFLTDIRNLSKSLLESNGQTQAEDPWAVIYNSEEMKKKLFAFTFEELREAHENYASQLKISKTEDNPLIKEEQIRALGSTFDATPVGKSFNIKKMKVILEITKERFAKTTFKQMADRTEVLNRLEEESENVLQEAKKLNQQEQSTKCIIL
jgi:hypothetical protein